LSTFEHNQARLQGGLFSSIESKLNPPFVELHRQLHAIRRLRRNPVRECYEFQQQLLTAVTTAEKRIRRCREEVSTHRSRLTARDVRLSKDEARAAKRQVEHIHQRIEHYRWVMKTARSLADGLAFVFLPKWDIKPLALKEPAGFISGKSGLALERRILRALAMKRRQIAFLNDLTNCLRYGDITLANSPPLFFEVKSGSGSTERDRRQLAQATEVAEFLRNDVAPTRPGSSWPVRRTELAMRERHHRRLVAGLIHEAEQLGFATRWPEPGLCYLAMGQCDVKGVLGGLLKRFSRPLAITLFGDSLPSYYEPLSLTIADSSAWWLTATGEVSLVVLVDLVRVVSMFKRKGLDASWDANHRAMVGQGWSLSSAQLAESHRFHISGAFFCRVAGEFLGLQWFVDETVARYNRFPLDVAEYERVEDAKATSSRQESEEQRSGNRPT
jgi:hypothetical protein